MKHSAVSSSLTDEAIADVARVAEADPRTVMRRALGLPVRARRVRERIDRELESRGLRAAESGGTRA